MGKEKVPKEATTWAGKMKEFGGGDFTFLSGEGEAIICIVVALPVLMKGSYKGKENDRIGCPIVTDEGFQLLICGKRLARKISKFEAKFKTNALLIVRHGTAGDVNATYDVKEIPESETFTRLDNIKKKDFEPSLIDDAVKDAQLVLIS